MEIESIKELQLVMAQVIDQLPPASNGVFYYGAHPSIVFSVNGQDVGVTLADHTSVTEIADYVKGCLCDEGRAKTQSDAIALIMQRIIPQSWGKSVGATEFTHYLEDVIFVLLGCLRGVKGGLYVDGFLEGALKDKDPMIIKIKVSEDTVH